MASDLKEYERTKVKIPPRLFQFVKNLCEAHHISTKELVRYYRKWVEGKRLMESLLPEKRGAKPGNRRTPKEIERNILKAYRRFGSNRYELVCLFKPYYLDKMPSSATMDRIKARHPHKPCAKESPGGTGPYIHYKVSEGFEGAPQIEQILCGRTA